MNRSLSLFIIVAFLTSCTTLYSQTLRRVDEGIRYRPGPFIDTIKRGEWKSWTYNHTTHQWDEIVDESYFGKWVGDALGESTTEDFSPFHRPYAFSLRRAVIGLDTVTLLYENDDEKEAFPRILIVDADSVRDSILPFLDSLNLSTEATYSPGVRTFLTPVLASSSIKWEDSIGLDNLIRDAETPASGWLSYNLAFAIYPVKIDGVMSVRFILGTPDQSKKEYESRLSPSTFDHGYYEIPLSDFRAFISALQ